MESTIVKNLRPEFEPVAVVWSDTIPADVFQYKNGTDPVRVPQGADCNSIAAFAYAEAEMATPSTVLGMLGVDGRRGYAQAVPGRYHDTHPACASFPADGTGGRRLCLSDPVMGELGWTPILA